MTGFICKVSIEFSQLFPGLISDTHQEKNNPLELPGLYHFLPADIDELHFELQRFAAEDEGRTEAPTERRQREERDKGNVPKSNDLSGAAVLIGGVVMMFFTGGYILSSIMEVFRYFLTEDFGAIHSLNIEDIKSLGFDVFMRIAKIVAPIMAAAFVMAIVGNVSQFGLLFTMRAIEFKPERIMPDFKRVLPVRRNIMNLLKIVFQVSVVGTAAWFVISQDYLPMLKAANMQLNQAVLLFAWTAMKLLLITAVILLAISIPDFFYQRFEYMENLKMSLAETKQERREEEGDPLLKQRQRERGQSLMQSQRSMLEAAATADVVITNPTHYAVALYYDRENPTVEAPVVVAKGQDHMAFTIRQIAKRNNIHIEENPPLARVLYSRVELNEQIPRDLYKAITLIFVKLSKFNQANAV